MLISFAGLRDRDGIKEREEGKRGRGRLFKGGDYFNFIIHSTQYLFSDWPKAYSELSVKKQKHDFQVCFVD